MGKGKRIGKLRSAKRIGWEFYDQKWRGKEKVSPAFKEIVYATRSGWNHIVEAKKRTKAEQIRRLKVLPLAKKMLETATTYQEHRIGKDKITHYFALSGYIGGSKIKVIVRSKGFVGKKYFLSVMVLK